DADLKILPYKSGFFITIPCENITDEKISDKLKDENIFNIIIPGAIRLAVCSIPKYKIHGLAQKIKNIISKNI
ncbi:MAG: aspartate aminotransferase, partial [Cetobacterium sp.]